MGDDNLRRVFDKLDVISERLARVETLLAEREKLCVAQQEYVDDMQRQIQELEKGSSSFKGTVAFVAWIVTTGIAVLGVIMR